MPDSPAENNLSKRPAQLPLDVGPRHKRKTSVSLPTEGSVTAPLNRQIVPRRTEAAQDVQWYCRVFETELGPLPFATLCEMVKSGQLGPDDRVHSGDTCFWQAVRGVAALQPLFTTAEQTATSARPFDQQPKVSSLADEWHYRLDDREHGPITLAALQDLIGSSGQTAEQVLVRQVGREEWIPFFELPANSALACTRDGRIDKRAADASTTFSESRKGSIATAPSAVPVPGRTLRQMARDNRDILVFVALWGLLNIGVLLAWSDPYATERTYLTSLRGLEGEIHALQSQDASAKEWSVLRTKAKETLAPIVADLKKSASASQPLRQHLLWAARDQLPKLIRPPDRESKEVERLYRNHVEIVERQLGDR